MRARQFSRRRLDQGAPAAAQLPQRLAWPPIRFPGLPQVLHDGSLQ